VREVQGWRARDVVCVWSSSAPGLRKREEWLLRERQVRDMRWCIWKGVSIGWKQGGSWELMFDGIGRRSAIVLRWSVVQPVGT